LPCPLTTHPNPHPVFYKAVISTNARRYSAALGTPYNAPDSAIALIATTQYRQADAPAPAAPAAAPAHGIPSGYSNAPRAPWNGKGLGKGKGKGRGKFLKSKGNGKQPKRKPKQFKSDEYVLADANECSSSSSEHSEDDDNDKPATPAHVVTTDEDDEPDDQPQPQSKKRKNSNQPQSASKRSKAPTKWTDDIFSYVSLSLSHTILVTPTLCRFCTSLPSTHTHCFHTPLSFLRSLSTHSLPGPRASQRLPQTLPRPSAPMARSSSRPPPSTRPRPMPSA